MGRRSASRDLVIGYWNDPAGHERPLYLREAHRAVHTAIFGGSGTGKTYLMEHMIREDIRRGRGVCVLDPKGDLYNRLVRFCHIYGYARKLVLINPNDEEWAVALNYLECDTAVTSAVTHAQTVARGINKVYGDEDPDQRPQLTRWLENTIAALVAARLTLEDAQLFLTNPGVRNRILAQIGNPYLASEWQVFEKAAKHQDDWLASVMNRLSRFYKSDVTRRILGQQTSRLDFRKLIDDGAIILANLAPGRDVSREDARLLGVILIDKVTTAARSRVDVPPHRRRRMYLYLDEFHNYLCEDIALGLKELRAYGLSFVLATQELAPIREEEFRIYSAIQANTDIKIAFAVQPDDVELLTASLFPEYLSADRVKRVLERTFFRPVLGRAQITTHSTNKQRGTAQTSGVGHSEGLSGGTSGGSGLSLASRLPGMLVPNDEGFYAEPMTQTSSENESNFSADSSTDSRFSSNSANESEGEATSAADAPFYYLEEDSEVAAITDYTPEEKRLHVMAKLVTLPKRHAVIKVRDKPGDAITIRTPVLKTKQHVVDRFFQRTLQAVYERTALPVVRVNALIETRRQELLQLPSAQEENDDFTYTEGDVHRKTEKAIKVQKSRRKAR